MFTCWAADGSVGVVSGYRIHREPGRTNWYWAALVRPTHPLLHVAEWSVPARADPLLVKAHGLWAEHVCDAPLQQWTVANETYVAALDDPADALGRAYGVPTALAWDLEWYGTAPATPLEGGFIADGFVQEGVVHGLVELVDGPVHLTEVPARRWRRWGDELGALAVPVAYAHTGLRAPFAFPDRTVTDWTLTPDGWRSRTAAPTSPSA